MGPVMFLKWALIIFVNGSLFLRALSFGCIFNDFMNFNRFEVDLYLFVRGWREFWGVYHVSSLGDLEFVDYV